MKQVLSTAPITEINNFIYLGNFNFRKLIENSSLKYINRKHIMLHVIKYTDKTVYHPFSNKSLGDELLFVHYSNGMTGQRLGARMYNFPQIEEL